MSLSAPSLRQAADSAGALWPHWPFCSRRCQLIDLGRWLGGDYRITGPSSSGDDDPDATDAPDADASKPAVPSADPHSHEAP